MPSTAFARLRGNLSLLISCLALAVALSGTAYAVAALPRGSVDTQALAKDAVTAKKIKAGAVRSSKIRPGAVGAQALADESIGAAELAAGSVGPAEVADGAVASADLADAAVVAAKLAAGSVSATKLAGSSVGTEAVADRSVRLLDLGGAIAGFQNAPVVNRTSTVASVINIAAGDCQSVRLGTFNPAPSGTLGSMVVGTITDGTGGAVVNNLGFVTPTLATETSQGGVVFHLGVCAGASAQTIPVGSIVTWSLIAP